MAIERSSSDDSDNGSSKIVLVPIEQRHVDFYGDEITAVLVELDDKQSIYVPLRPLCDYLGLNWSAQLQRTRRDAVLGEALISVFITHTEIGRGKGGRESICLPLEMLPGWLFGINASRVKPELSQVVIRYQRECFPMLWRAWQAEALRVVGVESTDVVVRTDISELERIRDMNLAMARMADQQIELSGRIDVHETRLNTASKLFSGLVRRVAAVEEQLAPTALITETQSEQVADRVKALAEYLNNLDPKKKPPYGAIFAELYRRFGVSDYHHIKRGQFDEVMAFLNDWRSSAGAGRLPDQLYMFGDNE